MASVLTRSAINAVLEDKELQRISSSRIEGLQRQGKALLNRVTAGDSERHAFEEFSTEIVGILKDIWICLDAKRTSSCKREKLWSSFHQACLFQLPGIWEKFLSALHIDQSDDILQQSVNQKIIEMILPTQLSNQHKLNQKLLFN